MKAPVAATDAPLYPPPPVKRRQPWWLYAALAVTVLVGLAIGLFAGLGGRTDWAHSPIDQSDPVQVQLRAIHNDLNEALWGSRSIDHQTTARALDDLAGAMTGEDREDIRAAAAAVRAGQISTGHDFVELVEERIHRARAG